MDIFLGGLGGAGWSSGAQGLTDTRSTSAAQANVGVQQELRDLGHQVQRLSLLNQALWELLSEKYGLQEDELAAKIKEVDLRDGVADGRMTETAMQCPKCGRVSNSKHYKCLYCGVNFKRPVMG